MALFEQEREDLMREATAYKRRFVVRLCGIQEDVFVGERSNGDVSIYIGTEVVLQFLSTGQLRRAFVENQKLRAESGRLFTMERSARGGQVVHSIVPTDPICLRTLQHHWAAFLWGAKRIESAIVLASIPSESKLPAWFVEWISRVPELIQIADRPNIS